MKLLLTSAGVKNPSIQQALLDLLGKPIAECNVPCAPDFEVMATRTSSPGSGPWRFISGREPSDAR